MKSVLVTGGTVRLGKAIAAQLRAAGWRVITSSHRPDAGADIVADLSEPLGAVKLYSAALRLLGGQPPDALVNNAALFAGEDAALAAVNLEAPKKLTTLMAGRETGVGAVVNVLDCRDREGKYGETKRALREFTRTAAVMFAETLRVNAVAPGPVLAPKAVHEKAGEMLLAHRPTPEDVGSAVSFLLSSEATTGTVIPVDAGQSLTQDNGVAES